MLVIINRKEIFITDAKWNEIYERFGERNKAVEYLQEYSKKHYNEYYCSYLCWDVKGQEINEKNIMEILLLYCKRYNVVLWVWESDPLYHDGAPYIKMLYPPTSQEEGLGDFPQLSSYKDERLMRWGRNIYVLDFKIGIWGNKRARYVIDAESVINITGRINNNDIEITVRFDRGELYLGRHGAEYAFIDYYNVVLGCYFSF